MRIPSALQQGDTIAIVCPSGYLPLEKSLQAKTVLESWGYNVLLGSTTASEYNYFSAPDEQRLADLQTALDNPEVKAILMGRGGYGLSRIIDKLDFTVFEQAPKWIIGFSDITVLHSYLHQQLHIATMHAPMCGAFAAEHLEQDYMVTYRHVLSGQPTHYTFPYHEANHFGVVTAPVVGGNLCMIEHLTGSNAQLDTKGKILFIEDIGEHLYKVDRMLINLKRSGQLDGIAGLVCGNFSDMEDTTRPFGANLFDLIRYHVNDLSIPIAFELPIGHETINYPLLLGATYTLDVNTSGTILQQINSVI